MTSAKDPLAEVWNAYAGTGGPDVLAAYDPVSRTALLTLPSCNITVAFTSTNVSLDQPLARYPGLSVVVSCVSDCTLLTTDCSVLWPVFVLWVHSNSSDAYTCTLQTSLHLGGCGCKKVHGGVDGCIVKIYQGCL